MIMVDRIVELMKAKNLTPSQFADEIGIQRSGMSHLISGRNKPSLEFLMKVLQRFPDVSPDYLLYGGSDPEIRTGDNKPEQVSKPVYPSAGTLFDLPQAAEVKTESKPPRPARKDRSEKKIEMVIVLFDDRTFREYEPE
jgi:transcriptional regulator with XRE-family HTH domain